jgi:hypothetical protein
MPIANQQFYFFLNRYLHKNLLIPYASRQSYRKKFDHKHYGQNILNFSRPFSFTIVNETLFLHANQSHLFIGNGKKNYDLKSLTYFDCISLIEEVKLPQIIGQKLGIPAVV